MLVVQDANQLGSILNHHAGALDRGSKRLVNVRRGALQADGVGLNEGIILQSIVVEHFNGLVIALKNAGNAHVTRGVQLLDAGQQAGGVHLQLHVAIFKLALDDQGVAVLLDIGNIGDLGQQSAGQPVQCRRR